MADEPEKAKIDKQTLLSKLVGWFEASEEATDQARKESELDRDYYSGIQWTSKEKEILSKRGQPCITINRIRTKINFVKGAEIQLRTRPRGFPRNPDDEEAANAFTDAIRFVCDNNKYDRTRSKTRENIAIEGTGAVLVGVRPKGDELEIFIKRFAWDRFFADPHSAEDDFSDAIYMGGVIWMDKSQAKEKYPKGAEAIELSINENDVDETFSDKPKSQVWSDPKRNRIRVVEIYYLEKEKWFTAIFTKGGFLVDAKVVPYVDEDGDTENPLIAQSLYIDRNNMRSGLVRDMRSPQDEVNKRRSKALHLLSVRQSRVTKGSGTDAQEVQKQLAKVDGVVETNRADDFEILPTGDMAIGHLNLMQEAKAEIDNVGPSASLQGKQQQALSGRALIAEQQGGMVEIAPFLDAGRHMDLRVYEAVKNRISQYWTEEKWIRVTDDDNNAKFAVLNRPITAGEAFIAKLEAQGVEGQELADAATKAAQDPDSREIVGIENNAAETPIDIIIEEAPNIPTIQQEEFESLVKLAQLGIIPGDTIIEASSLRNKDKLLKRMRGEDDVDPQVAKQQAAAQETAVRLELAGKAADIEETQSKTELNLVKASTEAAGS